MSGIAANLIHLQFAWRIAALLLAAAPLAYYIVAAYCAWRFFRRERSRTLPDYTPAVSLLKPVRGTDFGTRENFESFCRQDYPDYEILFAVNDASDPAIPAINRLIADFPERTIRLFSGADQIGANRKVNNLILLASEARYDVVVLTDGDVRVGKNYLREVVAPLADKKVGAVTSFYRGIVAPSLGAELEAIGASSDFFAGVLVAERMEGISFALGASVATTKRWLEKMGGLASIADMHSDDYELGNRIVKAGGCIQLSREGVWTMYPAEGAREFWDHQVRWARTVRLSRPLSYVGLIFTQGLPWAVLAAAIAPSARVAAAYLGAYLVLRFVMAWTVGVWGVGDDVLRRKIWLLPLRDAIYFIVWIASFVSNRIVWGGKKYRMEKDRMEVVQPATPSSESQAAENASH